MRSLMLSRRIASTFLRHSHRPTPPFSSPFNPTRLFSSEPKPTQNGTPNNDPQFKHQEIEGPTVERDLSPLANETRDVTHRLMKSMYTLSNSLALLSLSHISLGAYVISQSPPPPSSAAMGGAAVAFGVPFAAAFMLRQSVKHMRFFYKMEQLGRLQVMTSTMQIVKGVVTFFDRFRVVVYLSLAGLPLSVAYSVLSSSSSLT